MSRGALGLAALTAAGLFVAVFLGLPNSKTFYAGGPPIPRRALAAPSMMQVLRDEHDLFEDISKEETPAEPSPPGQLTAELLAPEQWAPRPGSLEPLVPEPPNRT
jgi:hypothetical protein